MISRGKKYLWIQEESQVTFSGRAGSKQLCRLWYNAIENGVILYK